MKPCWVAFSGFVALAAMAVAPAAQAAAPDLSDYEGVGVVNQPVGPGGTAASVAECPAGKSPLGGGVCTENDDMGVIETFPSGNGWFGVGSRGPTFDEGLRLFGYEMGSHYVGDLLQHSGDVRHALNRARPADDEALVVALDFYLGSFDQALTGAGPGAVELTVADEHWALGLGETVASVAAERYELFRCLGGRRSEAQVRALQWQGDIDAILPVVSRPRSNRSR